jgi:hypothetical protein
MSEGGGGRRWAIATWCCVPVCGVLRVAVDGLTKESTMVGWLAGWLVVHAHDVTQTVLTSSDGEDARNEKKTAHH